MKRGRIFFFMAALFLLAGLAACGEESDDYVGPALGSFSEKVKLCTPYLGDSTLDVWADWDPDQTGSVLGKLFDPDIGGQECIYTQTELLDAHIAMVNEFIEYWEDDGTYTIGDVTAVIDNDTSSVYVPYLRTFFSELISIPVDREITLTDSGDGLTVHMAFLIDGNEEYIVEQYAIGSTSAGVYYTERNGDSLRIWHASVDTDKVQFTWEGDTGDQWFKITQCTDATGNWEVMGGGSIADGGIGMAFMARNDETNSSNDEYYLTITLDDLNAGDEPDGGVIALGTSTLSGSGVLAYITEGEPECFGFLGAGAYPDDVDDLAWNQ